MAVSEYNHSNIFRIILTTLGTTNHLKKNLTVGAVLALLKLYSMKRGERLKSFTRDETEKATVGFHAWGSNVPAGLISDVICLFSLIINCLY